MNDESDKPLNPTGDDALEARIVAWVLGEASSFEAAELEKLCAADPALRRFEQRIRDLHGLIGEDVKAGPDSEWKLPGAKREKITDLLGTDIVRMVPEKPTDRYFRRRILLAAAACLMISVVAYSTFGTKSGKPETSLALQVAPEAPADRVERLRKAVAAQEDSVEDKRKLLSQIIRQEGIIYQGDQSVFHGSGGYNEAVDPKNATEALLALQRDKQQLESQIETLQKYEGEQLTEYASGLAMPDNVIPELLPKYQEQKREYETLKNSGLGADHPEVAQKAAVVGRMQEDLTEASANIREILKAKLQLANEQTAKLESRMSGKKDGAIKKGIANQSFVDAKGEFESSQRVLEQLKVELAKEVAGAGADEGALALNDAAPARRGGQPVTRAAAPAKPASTPEQELPQLAKAKKMSSAGVGGAGGVDSFAGAAPAEADSLASNTERFRRQETFGRNLRGMADDSGNAPMNTDLAAVAEEPAAMPEAASAPADVRLNELADLDQERAASTPVSPAAPAVTPMGPGIVAGKDIQSDRFAYRVGSDSADPAEVRLGLNFLSSSDSSGAPADFFDLRRMGEVAEDLKVSPQAETRLGGVLSFDSSQPPAPPLSMDFEVLDRLARNAPGMDAPSGAPISPAGATAFESLETPSLTLIPAEQPVGEVARSLEGAEALRKRGRYEEIRQMADAALAADPNNAEAKRLKESLGDPIATNPALSYQTEEQKDKTRQELYTAEGLMNLGKYDDASRAYEEALKIDPFNKAARRGMERAALAKNDNYRAAYDHTRAELLAKVGQAWELKMPALTDEQVIEKTNSIRVPVVILEDVSVAEALEFLRNRSVELDRASVDGEAKGVPLVAIKSGDAGLDPLSLRIAKLELKDVPLAEAIKQVAEAAGLKHEVKNGTVVFSPGAKLEEKPKPEEKSDETSAAAQPFSTFSLHVSDASFKLAKAALERGELPDPASIRPEEFYNAFDYGDPAPGRGEPVACVLEQCANPITPQRNLVRIAVRAGSAGRGQSSPLNLTLLLDSSGSMEREDRHQGMTMAVQQLASLLKEGDTVSVIGFSRQPRLLVDRLPGTRAQELNALLAQTPSEGGTNLEEGLKLAEELAKRQFNAAAQNRIVLFTDGAANLGDAEPESLQAKIEAMRQDGIAFDAAGFGTDGLNDKLLERLTRNGNGRYYIVDRPEDADANFAKQLAGAFRPAAENVKVQVRFNPARVGKYKLLGFEEHRLNKEDFRNDAVDAAEMAADEAGNALYQIEPLPGGEGEIGEVSVRFRDAASGQMVERTWTIPYEAQAPAFDLASPSIQLAGLSAFAAEKLRQAPTAASIDFQQLGPIFAKVKARYPNSQAVSDLGTMIGKLK